LLVAQVVAAAWVLAPQELHPVAIQHPVKVMLAVQQLQVVTLVGIVAVVVEQAVLVVTGLIGTQAMKLLLAL
jgi:hypothetical protein